MEKMVTMKAYDGSLVQISEKDAKKFELRTKKIKKLLQEGKTLEEIYSLLEEEKF